MLACLTNQSAGILTVDLNMRGHHNENRTRRSKRKAFAITSSEIDSSKRRFYQVVDGHEFGDQEIDSDYAWLLSFVTDTNEQTVSSVEEVITEDMDPQYSMFLRDLTENGKLYKLKISRNDEPLKFLEYEELEKSDEDDLPTYANVSTGNSGDKVKSSEDRETNQRVKKSLHGRKGEISPTKEMSRKKKIKEHKRKSSGDMRDSNQRVKRSLHGRKGETSTTKEMSREKKIKERKSTTDPFHDVPKDSFYHMLLDGCIQSEYGAFVYEGKQVKYEEKPASSDSDILIWDNLQGCSEVNNKEPMTAKKDISLKEKLMHILRQPYNRKEHKKLSEYVEQQKPICRLLPLRGRVISSAFDGPTKSVLDNVSTTFRRKLEAAQNDRPRALNLLRMFCFWLEHVPNEDIFQPWLNEECLKVLPSTRRC